MIKIVRIKLVKKYYKRRRYGEEPISYKAKQPKGKGTTIYATIYLDPSLKKHKDIRKAMLKHEIREIMAWGIGSTRAHTLAKKREPKITRKMGGVSGFWKEIRKREK